MFNLIITIISIALVIGLAAATVFYGGSTFTNSSRNAEVAKYVAQGQQLSAAIDMFVSDRGTPPADINALAAGGFLKDTTLTSGQNWNSGASAAELAVADDVTCREFNTRVGLTTGVFSSGVPNCTDVPEATGMHCCNN